MKLNSFCIFLLWVGCSISNVAYVEADEPAERFLEALRDNGYYDLALDYLKTVESNPAVSAEFKKIVPFERAETLIKSTTQIRDVNEWEQRLDEAEALLTSATANATEPEMLSRAQRYQADLLYRRARAYMRRSDSDKLVAAEKQPLEKRAQELLTQSLAIYKQAQQSLKEYISSYRIDPEDADSEPRLKRLRITYTRVRIRTPLIAEQLADTYADGSTTRTDYLTTAAREYAVLWDKYYKYPAGLDSCLFAARCHYKLGNMDRALSYVHEIFALNDVSALQGLKRQSMVLAANIWRDLPDGTPYPFDDVIANFKPRIERLSRTDARHPDWQRIRIELAQAYRRKANALTAQPNGSNTGKIKKFNLEAVKIAKDLSRTRGPFRDLAIQLLGEWDLNVSETTAVEAKPVETFSEAKALGADQIGEVEMLLDEISTLKQRIRATQSNDERTTLESELADASKRLGTQSDIALNTLDTALSMADAQTARTDINHVRYLQSVCHYAVKNYLEAAVVGEFLVKRYPNDGRSRQAANLALKCYSILHDKAPSDDRQFEYLHLTNICNDVLKRWRGTNEAASAAGTLTRLALNEKDYVKAELYFADVPADSILRNKLAVRMGQNYWLEFKRKRATNAKTPGQFDDAVVQKTLTSAKEFMVQGLKNVDEDDISYEFALAALFLTDAHLTLGEVDAAIAQLETADVPPLDLIKMKHPSIMNSKSRDVFIREAYKTAVKAYLAAFSQNPEQEDWIDRAQGVIRQMRQDATDSNDPNAQQKVVLIYQMIAQQLIQQFDSIQGKSERSVFAANLSRFLTSIADDSKDAKTVLWAGSTLMSIADALALDDGSNSAPMYKKSVEAFDRVTKLGIKDDRYAAELKRLRALANRGQGKFQAAMDELTEVLKLNQSNLKAQIDAAETLTSWGIATKSSKILGQAMMGTAKMKPSNRKRAVNSVWGWRKLTQALQSKPKFKQFYIQSLFHLTQARFEYGLLKKNSKAINNSKIEIDRFRKRFPDFGGPDWRTKFELLESRIRKQL